VATASGALHTMQHFAKQQMKAQAGNSMESSKNGVGMRMKVTIDAEADPEWQPAG